MKTVVLHGWLGKRFGTNFKMEIASPAEAIRALCSQLPGFKRALADDIDGFKLFAASTSLGKDELHYPFSDREELHIYPVVAGASEGKNPLTTILIGVVLLVAAYFTMGSSTFLVAAAGEGMFSMGVAMVLGGVASLLFAPSSQTTMEKPENRPSYNFNGPVNTVQQGGAVPLLYGELIIGSQVVSAGLFVEDVKA